MGRIKENDRLPVLDAHAGHWTEANALPDPKDTLTMVGACTLSTSIMGAENQQQPPRETKKQYAR